MANQEHINIIRQGVDVWNSWRKNELWVLPDLSTPFMISPGIGKISELDTAVAKAGLSKMNLSGANLGGTNLGGTNLSLTNLSEANLVGANLSFSDLCESTLIKADLNGANLEGASLRGANLTGTTVGGTIFGDIDLSMVEGLETLIHWGPSTIGIDTIYRSQGNIPEAFLRGAGVPDVFITYARSLVGHPIDYYTCFISHSSRDKLFCDRLYADLQVNGVRCWYFPEDATWGQPVWREIDRGIKVYDKLVVVCSEHSLQSGPVQREMERALNREDREGKNILFPIRIDNYLFDCWEHERKADVVSKVVGDFREWDRNATKYNAALQRLLKALKAKG